MFEGDGLLRLEVKYLFFLEKKRLPKRSELGSDVLFCLGWFFSSSRQWHGGTRSFQKTWK